MAKFFKSLAFKCTAVLLAISCVSGGLLALLNDLLYVSPEERTSRALAKIYTEEVVIDDDDILLDVDNKDRQDSSLTSEYGKINKIYRIGKVESGNYDLVLQSVGNQGYKGGTITLWVKVVIIDNDVQNGKLDKVVLESYDKQTLMSKFEGYYYQDFVDKYESGKLFTATNEAGKINNPMTGATYSAIANCNAINCVIDYLQKGGAK